MRQQRTLSEVRAAADQDSDGVLGMNGRTMQEVHRCFGHDFTVEEGFIVEDFHRWRYEIGVPFEDPRRSANAYGKREAVAYLNAEYWNPALV